MLLLVVAFFVALVLVTYRLALSDIFFATCPEGQIKVITKGDSYHDFIHSVKGYKKEGNKLVPGDEPKRDWLLDRLGIYWIGHWPIYKVYTYRFDWPTVTRGKEEKIERRSKVVNTVFFRFEYPLQFSGLETQDNYRTEVVVQVLTEVFCPELALFKARNWLNVLKAAIESKVRDFIGGYDFEEIRGMKTEVVNHLEFVREIIGLNEKTSDDANPGMKDTIGVSIVSVSFQSIDADPEDRKILKAKADAIRQGDAAIEKAKREAEAAIAEAEGKAKARRIAAAAEKEYLDNTTMHVASNPEAAEIEKIDRLPKGLQSLVQKGAVNVNVGGGTK